MSVMVWFYNHRDTLNPLMDETLDNQDEESDAADDDDDDHSDDNDAAGEKDKLDKVILILTQVKIIIQCY